MIQEPVLRTLLSAAYLAVSALSLAVAERGLPRERGSWRCVALALALLAAGKQLRLIDALTGAGRTAVTRAGWYPVHHDAQAVLACLLLIAFAALILVLVRRLRPAAANVRFAVGALALLIAFILLRAISIHRLDEWTIGVTGGMRRAWWFELGALLVICGSALRSFAQRPAGR